MKIKNIKIYTVLLTLLITGATLTGCHEKQSKYPDGPYRAQRRDGICYDENGNIISLEEYVKKFFRDENGNSISIEEYEEMFHYDEKKLKNPTKTK